MSAFIALVAVVRRYATATLAVALGMLWAAGGAQAASVRVETVCFSVHNGTDARASTLFGQRYTVGRVTPRTPAIVLVHGVASSTANWDFTRRSSVARRLARAGYVVISYDRLGFGAATTAARARLLRRPTSAPCCTKSCAPYAAEVTRSADGRAAPGCDARQRARAAAS